MLRPLQVISIIIVSKFFLLCLVKTYFVADEYYQSLEIAHNLAFGYGYKTWEWNVGIRSYIYPVVIAIMYKFLELLHLDNVFLLIYTPRFLHMVLSCYSDYCFYLWCGKRKWALFSILSCWAWCYTCTRTLINTVECALTTIAIAQYPWDSYPRKSKTRTETESGFLWYVGILCAVRPTAAILWVPFIHHHIRRQNHPLQYFLHNYIPKGLVVLVVSTLIDSYFYGRFILTPYEFFKFNIYYDVGEWYGKSQWFSSIIGFIVIFHFTLIPFFDAVKVFYKRKNEYLMICSIFWTLMVYSLLSHQEFRFLLPLVPLVLYLISKSLTHWSLRQSTRVLPGLVCVSLGAINLLCLLYLGLRHQRGTLDVMTPLQEIARTSPNQTQLLILMPCHSVPMYSHLHVNISVRMLTCEPPVVHNNTPDYVDEADNFYINPVLWWIKNYSPFHKIPSHIIVYDSLAENIREILMRYELIGRFHHTDFPSGRVGRNVLLYQKQNFSPKHDEQFDTS